MRKSGELLLFGLLAIGLHMVLMAEWPDQGAEAGGVGGEALVTLAGATQQIETLVSEWTRPPDAAQQVDIASPVPDATPNPPQSPVRVESAPNAPMKLATMQAPEAEAPPQPEAQALVPPPPPEPTDLETTPAPIPPRARPEPRIEAAPEPETRPDRTQRKASAGSASQKAAGSGGASQAGSSGRASAKTLAPGQEASLTATWGARIRTKVERRKRYPSGTRASGTVTLKISVDRTGQLRDVSVRQSSGNVRLDGAAVSAVRNAGRFPAAPKELTRPVFNFTLPIRFSP